MRTDRVPWEVVTADGITVGRLAQRFQRSREPGDVSATVLAIARWNKTKSEGTFLDRLKSDEWEVVISEIVVGRDPWKGQVRVGLTAMMFPGHPSSGLTVGLTCQNAVAKICLSTRP